MIRLRRNGHVAAPLDGLRQADGLSGPLNDVPLVKGLIFRIDPAARITGQWSSPRGRLIELRSEVAQPGAWFGLHVTLALPDLRRVAWLGFVARTASLDAIGIRPCLRSGLPGGGFHDAFFDRHILAHAAETDHHDIMDPARQPGLPPQAPWREFILFLPPRQGITWSLHDLRLFTIPA